MSAVVFDGKKVALEKEIKLETEVKKLKRKGLTPKLVSILIGEDKGSKLYLALKKKAAEGVGVKLEIKKLPDSEPVSQLVILIKDLNQDNDVHGIMVQLPLPANFSLNDRKKVISAIAPEKDVDGMRDDSQYLTPVVKAVLIAIKAAGEFISNDRDAKIIVVGAEGFVGKKIVEILKKMGYEVKGVGSDTANLSAETRKAEVLISAAGRTGLIKGNRVKGDAVVIDVGAPKGDVQFNEVANKASFISPVPGGIGPITISILLENLVEAARIGLQ